MNEKGKTSERERRDWMIILIILLIGFLCVIVAGEQAARFSPRWSLDSNMRSNLDPNSDFLTNRPDNFYEPLDPSILTQQIRINNFLTPGALFEINTSQPSSNITNTPVGTNTPAPTLLTSPTAVNSTNTPIAATPSPTYTLIYYPPPPSTNTPKPPPTNTPVTPLPTADLAITKNDGGLTAVDPNDTISYTVRVTNNGPSDVTGTILSDPAATGLSKTAVACSLDPGQCTTAPTIAELEGGTFALPTLNNGQFYEITVSAIVTATSGSITNTASIQAPTGIDDLTPGNNSASDTNTVNMVADLSITVTDQSTSYEAGAVKLLPNTPPYAYTITIANAGPSNVTGATVSNAFTDGTTGTYVNVDSSTVGWVCTASPGAACPLIPFGAGNLNNTSVDLNSGSSITFYLAATVVSTPSGDLVNTVTVTAPSGVADAPGNNSDTDTDALIQSLPFPYPPSGEIGTSPDDVIYTIPSGTSITLSFGTPLDVGSHAGFDLIYYELPNGTGIAMDLVILQLGDGSNWYTIFNWGNGLVADTNSNMNIAVIGGEETDNRDFTTVPNSNILYPFNSGTLSDPATGITIELDGVVPNGTYPYIRIISPSPDSDGGVEVDAIYVVP